MKIKFQDNTLYYGVCLDIMSDFPGGCIDLICLDPPFNSKRQYNQIFRNSGLKNDPQIKAFDDMWLWNEQSAERVERIKMGETSYPPIQVFSIEEYFRHDKDYDKLLKLPPLANPWTGKAMPPSLF